MSSSGLIYAAIVGLWAACLVPMWLRRQDELAEHRSRSPDRISIAMRALTRRAPAAAEHEDDHAEPGEPVPAVTRRPPAPPFRSRAAVLAHRRQVMGTLVLTSMAGFVLTAVAGLAWSWLPATTGLLLSLYIRRLRLQENRRARRRRRRALACGPRRQPSRALPPPRRAMGATQAGPATDPHGHHDAAGEEAPERDTWQPAPVPLPTYITAPVAHDGRMWTYQRGDNADPDEQATAQPEPKSRGEEVYDQYADTTEALRAVND